MNQTLTRSEACHILNISQTTLDRLIASKEIEHSLVGLVWCVPMDDVQRVLRSWEQQGIRHGMTGHDLQTVEAYRTSLQYRYRVEAQA